MGYRLDGNADGACAATPHQLNHLAQEQVEFDPHRYSCADQARFLRVFVYSPIALGQSTFPQGMVECGSISPAYRERNMNHTTQGLERFVEAQATIYHSVVAELAMGHKETHWMWFVFPQLKQLGRSPMAKYFGIESIDEARNYFAHPVLGRRLIECTKLMLAQRNANALEILGSPDDIKFRSSMTLFSIAAPKEAVFKQALDAFFSGKPDEATVKLLT